MQTKQVIAIRADLKLRRGKECSQAAHASGMFMRARLIGERISQIPSNEELLWLYGNFRKIVVKVEDEKQLLELHQEAKRRGLTSYLVVDDGLTEVPPNTTTALAIGPHREEVFVDLTDNLPLY